MIITATITSLKNTEGKKGNNLNLPCNPKAVFEKDLILLNPAIKKINPRKIVCKQSEFTIYISNIKKSKIIIYVNKKKKAMEKKKI